jgi:hypothetical protein
LCDRLDDDDGLAFECEEDQDFSQFGPFKVCFPQSNLLDQPFRAIAGPSNSHGEQQQPALEGGSQK